MRAKILLALSLGLACCGRSDDQTIVAYSRENNSGTYMYFKEHVLNNEDFGESIQTLPGTAAVINAVSKDRRSIGYGGIGYAKGVKVLPVRKEAGSPAVEPTMANVVDGSYPISRSLYFYTVGQPDAAVKDFIDWATSEEGQKICENVGYYPIPKERWVKPSGEAPSGKHTITIKGSDTMVILGQRWAEHYMQKRPDVQIQVTGGGSGTGIAALIDGATNICQSSRPIKPKERGQIKEKHGKEVVEFSVALDGVAIFVSESNPIREISLPQLKDIYTLKTRKWNELAE
jgi:ABC-type phosphate transport system substrate-binding protein